MTGAALALVIVAAIFHASWNFCTKRSRDKLAFLWLAGVAGTLVLLPVVLGLTGRWSLPASAWIGMGVSALIRAAYFASLGAAYTRGDLSLVYPLARGIAPVLVPPLAVVLLGERLSLMGGLGIAAVALGVYVLHLPALDRGALWAPFRALTASHAGFAVLTGLMTAAYSIVDKHNMSAGVDTVLYAYVTIPGAALLLAPLALRRRAAVAAEWRANAPVIALVSVLMTAGYFLVLLAMRLAPVSYVAAARELGIVFGTVLGSVLLRERYLSPRLAGATLIVAGVALLAATPAPPGAGSVRSSGSMSPAGEIRP
jgi:drug/metabolite transporter (DMT)-like permease